MQAVSTLRPVVRADPRLRLAWPTDGATLFALSLFAYVGLAAILVFGYHLVVPETLSRVGNAYYALFSRDPHLAAIGFVWNPLPSLLVLPLLPLRAIWPALTEVGFAGNLVSALFMAGAVYQIHGLLAALGVARRPRLVLAALFGLHPLILYTGATGISEGIFLFFLVLAVRSLAGWLQTTAVSALVMTGLALAAACLTRDEGLPAALGALIVVGAVSIVRNRHGERWTTALADTLIVASPIASAVGLWTALTWIITGDPLHQLASIYGSGSQIHALQAQGVDVARETWRIRRGLRRVLALEPGLLPLGILALLALRKKDVRLLAPIGVMTPVLGVMFIAYVTGVSLPWLRYFIVVVPLAAILAGLALSASSSSPLKIGWPRVHTAVVLASLALAVPTSLLAMANPALGREESGALRAVLGQDRWVATGGAANLASSVSVARYLDRLQLSDGRVLVDSFTGFQVVLASHNPRQFVITNDRDFPAALGDPAGSGVEYLLVPSPRYQDSLSSLDAVNRAYPTLYQSGAGIASLVYQFSDPGGQPSWRLYRVLSP